MRRDGEIHGRIDKALSAAGRSMAWLERERARRALWSSRSVIILL